MEPNALGGPSNPLPLEDTPLSVNPQEQASRFNIASLIKDLLDREQKSSSYRGNLEVRLSEECVRLQHERRYRSQLEQTFADLQRSQFQLESAYRRVYEDNEILRQELAMERKKSQYLESRQITLISLQEILQKISPETSADGRYSEKKSIDTYQTLLENQRQQEQITELQVMNRSNEATIRTLQSTLQNALGAFSCYTDSDASTTAIEAPVGSGSLIPTSKENAPAPLDGAHMDQSWYEE